MLAGEGGENGIGSHRVWPTLSFPALTTEQIQKAIAGNTLAIPYHYAHQYGANGQVGGYNIRYDPTDLNKCPKTEIPGDRSEEQRLNSSHSCASRMPSSA